MFASRVAKPLVFFTLSIGILITLGDKAAAVSSANQPCTPIETVFARGSGEGKATDDASIKFRDSLKLSLGALHIEFHDYDLGTESYAGHKYPHVAISGTDGWYHGVGAWLTSGEGRAYGNSIHEGEGELKEYLNERMQLDRCTDSKYILGGFSQGAQVIGETLEQLTPEQRAKIVYVALFGDPTLNLPEGASSHVTDSDGVPVPDACLGINLSPWRHTIDSCFTYSGTLNARDPYVPNDMTDKVHDWCYKDDGICDNMQQLTGNGHNYTDDSGIATAVSEALFTTGTIPDGSLINLTSPSIKYDISFVTPARCTPLFRFLPTPPQLKTPYYLLDISSQNRDKINILPELLNDSFDNGQRAQTMQYINSYRRVGAQFILYFVDEKNCLDEYIGTQYGGLATMNTRLMFTRKFSAKLTGPQLPDPIIISETNDTSLCELTINTCALINSNSSSPYILAELGISHPPTIRPLVTNYSTIVGQASTYTVTTQPKDPDYYQTYAWDFDGNGTPDIATTSPSIQYEYLHPYSGDITITATSKNSSSKAVTTIHETALDTYAQQTWPLAPTHVTATQTSKSEVFLSWVPANASVSAWRVRINGYPLAEFDADRRNVTVGDLDFSMPLTFSVSAVNTDGREGPQTSATITPGSTVSDRSLDRTGYEDVNKLITAYREGLPIPSTKKSGAETPTLPTANIATLQQAANKAPISTTHYRTRLLVACSLLIGIAGATLYVVRKFKP